MGFDIAFGKYPEYIQESADNVQNQHAAVLMVIYVIVEYVYLGKHTHNICGKM